MGHFNIRLPLSDNTWSTGYNLPKNDRYSKSSTQWTLVILKFTIWNYGIRLVDGEIDTTLANTCFSNISVKHSVY